MAGRELRRQLAAGKRHRGDERHRGRGHGHQHRGDQVGVGEGRRLPRPEPAREAQADQVEPLEGERNGDPFDERPQTPPGRAVGKPGDAVERQRGERDAGRDRAVDGEAPAEGLDAVAVDEREDRHEAEDGAGAEAERGDPVVVECRERARGKPGEDLRGGRRDQPRDQLRGARPRVVVAREQAGDRMRSDDREGDRGHERDRERKPPRRRLPAEPPLVVGAGQPREDDDAERARHQDESQVDRVGGEEPVRLRPVPELAGEDRPCRRGRAADCGRREPGEDAASDRAPAT